MWESDGSKGHAVVCDGYQNDNEIHLDLGWSGAGTAWYNIDTVSYNGYIWTTHGAVFEITPPASDDWDLADCPSADLTGDCFVGLEDFAVVANQWLTGNPNIPDDMTYIPDGGFEMGDHFGEGVPEELPLHAVLLDSFFMGKYEITNQQYCDYLNSAYDAGGIKVDDGIVYASSDSSNSYPYYSTPSAPTGYPDSGEESQIDFSGGDFSVRTKGGRDMSNDPVVCVSWYGAVAFCNWRSGEEGKESCYNLSTWDCDFTKKGYRLATEAEWEYAARGGEHNPYYLFPWGDTISHSQANYGADPASYSYDVNPTEGFHPDWNDGLFPYTSVVGSFSPNGYGLYDMAGNVFEWCNDWFSGTYYDISPYDNPEGPASGTGRVSRGGSWYTYAFYCRVAFHVAGPYPGDRYGNVGFRIVLDLN